METSKFLDLVVDQFQYGGKKYANSDKKEVTDILVEDYGWNWLVGTVNKYVYRYSNLCRERDLLKIACYQYIKWLKLGYHLPGVDSAFRRFFGVWINTTVDVKDRYFPVFIGRLRSFKLDYSVVNRDYLLINLTQELKHLRNPFTRSDTAIFKIFKIAEKIWELDGFDKTSSHDTDTGNQNG